MEAILTNKKELSGNSGRKEIIEKMMSFSSNSSLENNQKNAMNLIF
jgi:hypothetical protein